MSTLYLVPTPLGGPAASCVTDRVRAVLRAVHYVIAEDRRCALRFIHSVDECIDVDAIQYYEVNEHTDIATIGDCLDPMTDGEDIALMTDAGCPVVADPGAAVVSLAHRRGLSVVPLAGASSIIMALMASGLGGQSFAMNGYLPVKEGERARRLRELEARSMTERQTQIFIETPYRNDAMLQTALHTLRDDTRLTVASSLTMEGESIRTLDVQEWKRANIKIGKVPAVFLISASTMHRISTGSMHRISAGSMHRRKR